jgi:hypothetical protein
MKVSVMPKMVPFLFDKGVGSLTGGGLASIWARMPSQVAKPGVVVAIVMQRQRRERRRCSGQGRNAMSSSMYGWAA